MSLAAFYADDVRANSPELGFGVDWQDSPEPTGRVARVAYVFATGELYAHFRDGHVEVLATFEPVKCGRCVDGCSRCHGTGWSMFRVEEALRGWERHVGGAWGLSWLRRRLRACTP